MLTIEEQIELIADHAMQQASCPTLPLRRWPAIVAAAFLLVTAGSVVWKVSGRESDRASDVAPSDSNSFPMRSDETTDSSTSTPLPSKVDAKSLVLSDPAGLGLQELTDRDQAQTVLCLKFVQAVPPECLTLVGVEQHNYSDPVRLDRPFDISVTTNYVGATTDDYSKVAATYLAGDETVASSDVTVRGTSGTLTTSADGRELLAWTERPGVVGLIRFENRPSAVDPIEVADSLTDESAASDASVPLVAIELHGLNGGSEQRSYVVMHHEGSRECVSVDYVSRTNIAGTCATTPLVWWSTVSQLEPGLYGGRDVVFGMAPSDAAHVQLTIDDGTTVSLETVAVPGFSHRAWAYVVPEQQGMHFSGTVVAGENTASVDFLQPTQNIDDLCSSVNYAAVVPSVVGLPIYDAAEVLRQAGVGLVDGLRGDPRQIVLTQNPVADTELGCGDVQLTVGATDSASSESQDASPAPVSTSPTSPLTAADICGTYTVAAGDFPASVAEIFDVTFESLAAANVDNELFASWLPGAVINVPCST